MRSGRSSLRSSPPPTPATSASLRVRHGRATLCSILPATSRRGWPGPALARSTTSAAAPMPSQRPSSAIAAPSTAASPITVGTSTPSHLLAKHLPAEPAGGVAHRPQSIPNTAICTFFAPVPARKTPDFNTPRYCQQRRVLVIRTPQASGGLASETGMAADKRAMRANNGTIKLVAGNSNPALADAIAAYLQTPMTKAVVRRFADMEIFVEIQENVRGSDVFVIQSTSFPANDHLMELLIIIDALRRASGRRVTAVIPYFGYARQDRKPGPRTPISAKLVSTLITRAGADRVMTLDLHAGQIQGFFDIPTDNLYASPMMVRDIKERFDTAKVAVVSPDVGGVARARGLAKRINAPLAIVDKRRERPGDSEVMNVIGNVKGRTCILVDDIVDSGGTLVNAAEAL